MASQKKIFLVVIIFLKVLLKFLFLAVAVDYKMEKLIEILSKNNGVNSRTQLNGVFTISIMTASWTLWYNLDVSLNRKHLLH